MFNRGRSRVSSMTIFRHLGQMTGEFLSALVETTSRNTLPFPRMRTRKLTYSIDLNMIWLINFLVHRQVSRLTFILFVVLYGFGAYTCIDSPCLKSTVSVCKTRVTCQWMEQNQGSGANASARSLNFLGFSLVFHEFDVLSVVAQR